MNWREHWKQASPIDQYLAILMAVDGSTQNIKAGIGGDKPLTSLEQYVEEMRALEPYLRRGSWEEPLLFQSYEGEVVHTSDDQVVVMTIIDDNLVEQTYSTSQFATGQVPQKGDIFEIRIQLIKVDRQEYTQPDQTYEPRRNTVPLPRTF
jgi:hypothetical protein